MLTERVCEEWTLSHPPTNRSELLKFCDGFRGWLRPNTFLFRDRTSMGRVTVPLLWKEETKCSKSKLIVNGEFALCFSYPIRPGLEIVVGRCGFNLCGDELQITQTPQGTSMENLQELGYSNNSCRSALASLRGDSFRSLLIADIVKLGGHLGVCRIVSSKDNLYQQFNNRVFDDTILRKVVDNPLENNGLVLSGGEYILSLGNL